MLAERTLAPEIIAEYKKLDVPSISDAMDKLRIFGALYGIKAVVPDTYLCGQAFTVHYMPNGTAKGTVGDFIDDILPGEVAVLGRIALRSNNNGCDGRMTRRKALHGLGRHHVDICLPARNSRHSH